jgi:hypothetical protein
VKVQSLYLERSTELALVQSHFQAGREREKQRIEKFVPKEKIVRFEEQSNNKLGNQKEVEGMDDFNK